jgi:general secretion pathway protein G
MELRTQLNTGEQNGFTLIELIAAMTILIIVTGMALPLPLLTLKREQEQELRRALWSMRDAIDRYKDAADRGSFQTKAGSEGILPPLAHW